MPVQCRVTQLMRACRAISVPPRHEDHSISHPTACPCCPFHCLEWSLPPIAASGIDTTSFSASGWPLVATKLIEREPNLLLGKMVAHHASK